jgi:protein-L-isoaspartate(D-aspartate) O-methyltransferase
MLLDFKAARLRMVESQLRARGISDPRVLEAFNTVPRHEFVKERLREEAYRDSPLPIGHGQTISQPYMVAAMTEAAQIQEGHKVLEIGLGSGYQAAILAALGAQVYSMERIASLAASAEKVLNALGYPVRVQVGDGTLGWPEEAPFDRIVVTAGAPAMPVPLGSQLATRGRLVIPIEDGFSQVLYVFRKEEQGLIEERRERCTFFPLIGEFGWKR